VHAQDMQRTFFNNTGTSSDGMIHAASADVSEVDLYLDQGSGNGFDAQMRVVRPGEATEQRVEVSGLVLDRAALLEHELDPAAYGRVLTSFLFSCSELRDAFTWARAGSLRLRIRLSLATAARELRDIQWEALADPHQPEAPLLKNPNVLFSRYMSSFDWRPVRLRPKQRLRALVVVANPSDLTAQGLAPVNVDLELEHARRGLEDADGAEIPCTVVCTVPGPAPGTAMLDRMLEALREEHDILYLVCHGTFGRQGPVLYLDGADGKIVGVPGAQLAQRLLELEERPRLVVLAACRSAGDTSEPASPNAQPLVAVGPQLVKVGIPAVVAMSGDVAMTTVAQFMPAFFRALTEDGQVDHAMAIARSAVTSLAEACRPVLFMRLRQGRIWYDSGFTGGDTLRSWAGLRDHVEEGSCIPILGPGLLETLFEYRSWLARRWAKQLGYPLAPSQREDLTHVAHVLAVTNGPKHPHRRFAKDLGKGIRERLPATAPPDVRVDDAQRLLSALLHQRSTVRANPYRILAELPLPVYLTFCPDSLLFDALTTARVVLEPGGEPVARRPRVAALAWKPELEQARTHGPQEQSLPDAWADGDYEPSVEEPLVYHFFGTMDVPESLVLTQDDYFDFLLNIQKPEVHKKIPSVVGRQLTTSSLLFLGFSLESWEFRAVFRMLLQQYGRAWTDNWPHFAAQVEPEEGRVIDPLAVRDLMHSAFKPVPVDLYFGKVEQFLVEMRRHMHEDER
jgi:CHAT domain/SIR2-like domain